MAGQGEGEGRPRGERHSARALSVASIASAIDSAGPVRPSATDGAGARSEADAIARETGTGEIFAVTARCATLTS